MGSSLWPLGLLALGIGLSLTPTQAQAQACYGESGPAGVYKATITSGELERTYLLDVPEGLRQGEGAPLVFNFHGFGSNGWQQWWLSDMARHSRERGMITVHPDGYQRSWNGGSCCGEAVREDIDDVQFVRDMIEEISAAYCINPNQIYATGMSNGGYFSHRLGCELSDQIAAIGPVAGRLTVECNPEREVPVFAVHGTEDSAVSFEGGFNSAATWAEFNQCSGTREAPRGPATTCTYYQDCQAGADVTFCAVEGGPHWWFNSPAFSTTESLLDFFLAHPLR